MTHALGVCPRWRALAAAVLLVLTTCSSTRRSPDPDVFEWSVARRVHVIPANPDLCEAVWRLPRPPGGPWDIITLHRIGLCGGKVGDTQAGPDVLYLPGTHMNGELMVLDEGYEFRLYLARRHVPVWSLDYRTHMVPRNVSNVEALRRWTTDVFLEDAGAALAFVRRTGRRPIVAGFSRGATFAYALATREEAGSIAGLIVFDGAGPAVTSSLGDPPAPQGSVIDVGSTRLPYEARQTLLARVIANPAGPSSDPSFATAGQHLAHILFTSRSFGGHGGLSAALHGRADIRTVAGLLASYDRYWPTAASNVAADEAAGSSPSLPVFAVASTNIGPRFTEAVERSARQVGGPEATVIVLPGHGHLDVLVGADVRTLVFEPLLRWIGRIGAATSG